MKAIDALALDFATRAVLRPGQMHADASGRNFRLPRFFWEIASWQQALKTRLTEHFSLAELIHVDCREAAPLFRQKPRYVPCAVSVLARYLEELRLRVAAPVFVSVNGGYRSPAHGRAPLHASPHQWAAAADIYRIGDTWLDTPRSIERFGRIAQAIGPEVRVKAFGHAPGQSDDHLHIDLGYLSLTPHGCGAEAVTGWQGPPEPGAALSPLHPRFPAAICRFWA